MMEKKEGPWYYEMISLGFNYRITDFQCALGLNQLKKLDSFLLKRRDIAELYNNYLKECENIILPLNNSNCKHAYHLYPVQVKFDQIRISKKELFEKMKEQNIRLQVHYIPVHLHPYYRQRFGFKKSDFPIAEKFYEQEISIPIYPLLEKSDAEFISQTIIELINK